VETRRGAGDLSRTSGGGPPFAALDRYLVGENTGFDDAVLDAWLSEHPDERDALASLKAFVRAPISSAGASSGDAMYSAIARRMQEPLPLRASRRMRVVAALGAFAAAIIVVLFPVLHEYESRPIGVTAGRVAVAKAATPTAVTVPAPTATVPETITAPASPAPSGVVLAARPSHGRAVSAERSDAASDAGLSRSPDDVAPAGEVSLADDRPGAADTHWP
jgi:hypothetical protein